MKVNESDAAIWFGAFVESYIQANALRRLG